MAFNIIHLIIIEEAMIGMKEKSTPLAYVMTQLNLGYMLTVLWVNIKQVVSYRKVDSVVKEEPKQIKDKNI